MHRHGRPVIACHLAGGHLKGGLPLMLCALALTLADDDSLKYVSPGFVSVRESCKVVLPLPPRDRNDVCQAC